MRLVETKDKVGKEVTLKGWVHSVRAHGSVLFLDLRDRSGIVQVVFQKDSCEGVEDVREEWVMEVKGEVKKRPESMINSDIETGEVEVSGSEIRIISKSETPPIPLDTDGYEIDEKKRLDYRYLDLRRERMKRNLIDRKSVV